MLFVSFCESVSESGNGLLRCQRATEEFARSCFLHNFCSRITSKPTETIGTINYVTLSRSAVCNQKWTIWKTKIIKCQFKSPIFTHRLSTYGFQFDIEVNNLFSYMKTISYLIKVELYDKFIWQKRISFQIYIKINYSENTWYIQIFLVNFNRSGNFLLRCIDLSYKLLSWKSRYKHNQ